MTEKNKVENQTSTTHTTPQSPTGPELEGSVVSPGTTEVKNAHASGLGAMGRHDEDPEEQEGSLQKD